MRRESHLRLDPDKVLRELNLRGVTAAHVARETGLSPTTLSGLLRHGRPITPASGRKLARWLSQNPVDGALAELLADEAA